MKSLLKGRFGAWCLLIATLLLDSSSGQEVGEGCLAKFKKGQDDFILDTDESVKEGATFLSSPKLGRYRDCVVSCCKEPKCNLAFMERGEQEGSIGSCFLFDCLYKMKYVCRFVRKKGFTNYIQDSVYESYLSVDLPPSESKPDPFKDLRSPPQEVLCYVSVDLNEMGSNQRVAQLRIKNLHTHSVNLRSSLVPASTMTLLD